MQGAIDGKTGCWEYADSPEKNTFYQMYRELSLHMADSNSVSRLRPYCATTWLEFCQLVTKYHKKRGGKIALPPAYAEHDGDKSEEAE